MSGVPLVRRLIADEAARFGITIVGVAMAVVLMCGLLAINDGVRVESNGWVSSRPIDVWVAQGRTTNFIKASSFLPTSLADTVRDTPGVREFTTLLRLITQLEHGERRVTAIVVGLAADADAGRPQVVAGSASPGGNGIVLDRALAHRLRAGIGDTVRLEGRSLPVVGLSRGTNSVLTQVAFIPLAEATTLLPVQGITSYFLVRGDGREPADSLAARLRARMPRAAALTQAEFAANNVRELHGGIAPILAAVAVLGAIVGAAVLALLLYGAVLERREDYALLKAVGAPSSVLARVVVGQALAAVAGGVLAGVGLYLLVAPLVSRVMPPVPLALDARDVAYVAAGALAVGLLAALLPVRRIARIHPAEVFRA